MNLCESSYRFIGILLQSAGLRNALPALLFKRTFTGRLNFNNRFHNIRLVIHAQIHGLLNVIKVTIPFRFTFPAATASIAMG